MSPSRRPSARVLVALAVGVVLVVLAVVLLAGGDEDELDALRDLPAVASATSDDGDTVVRLRSDASTPGIAAVLRAVPDERTTTEIRLGRASIVRYGDASADDPDVARALVAVSRTRAAGRSIQLQYVSSEPRLAAEVDDPSLAAPLARELLDRTLSDGRLPAGLEGLQVATVAAPTGRDLTVLVRAPAGYVSAVPRAAVEAAAAVPERSPALFATGQGAELRVRATGTDEVDAAWRDVIRALAATTAAVRRDVDIAVEVPTTDGPDEGERETQPVVSGPADTDPGRALALTRAMRRPGTGVFARTDLSYAQAQASSVPAARAAARAARAGGARRVAVSWPGPEEDAGWFGTVAPADRDRSQVDDAPARVLGLVARFPAMRTAGIPALRWDRPEADRVARLAVARPTFLDASATPAGDPARFRRLSRAIRTLGWRGPATLELLLGPGSCSSSSTRGAQAVARIVSTSTGRASSVEAGAGCTDGDALRAARRTWDAGRR